MKKFLKWFGVLLALSLCGLVIYGVVWFTNYQSLVDEEPEVVLSPAVSNISYCSLEGESNQMDLHFPAEDGPWQVLVYVHGGSFTSGDKQKGSGIVDIPAMTARGYAVAAVNYRLMPDHPFPAEIIDVKCAIRYLRAHADEYNLRTEKIGIWGGSAGGHLATMIGLTGGDPAFESEENREQSSHVDAVVEMFGPTDLTMPMNWLQRNLLRRAFGTDSTDSPILHEASPIFYVTQNAPPFLILHGEQDSAVPVEQAQILHEKLSEAGVDARLVIVANANHNFKPTGGPVKPTRTEISAIMGDFFDQKLK